MQAVPVQQRGLRVLVQALTTLTACTQACMTSSGHCAGSQPPEPSATTERLSSLGMSLRSTLTMVKMAAAQNSGRVYARNKLRAQKIDGDNDAASTHAAC